MEIKTRFAPSPTGFLHIGGARTALFSWLYARRMGGKFVLRIEDTDLARSTQESVDMLIRDLKWLGLDWDEGPADDGRSSRGPAGPYFQSQRLEIYAKYLEELKAKNLAYPTFESKEDVEAARESAIASGAAPTAHYEEATPGQVAEAAKAGRKPAWRFRIPEGGATEFKDLIHGDMRFENKLMSDIVIVRSDGMPTYNFAAVVDDALMGITHVIRGDDHLSNTPRQVCLFRALGLRLPEFAHIPMILGPDKQRLSKRHGATAVGEYESAGFLPEALFNHLALLGWSLDDKTTLLTADELKANFSLERVTKHAAVFDNVKLEWMNGQYVRKADLERLAGLCWPHFVKAGLVADADRAARWPWFLQLVKAVQEKVRTLGDLPADCAFFFADKVEPSADAKAKFFEAGHPAWLAEFMLELMGLDFQPAAIEASLRAFCDAKGLKFKHAVGALRPALSGRTVTPGLFETMSLLGKEKCAARLAAALEWKP